MWKWNGHDRAFRMSLRHVIGVSIVKNKSLLMRAPHSAERNLHKRVDERLEFTFFAAPVNQRLFITGSRKNNGPEIYAVHILPVVDLFIRILISSAFVPTSDSSILYSTYLALHFHTVP